MATRREILDIGRCCNRACNEVNGLAEERARADVGPLGEEVCRGEITEGEKSPKRETPPGPLFRLLWRQIDEYRWMDWCLGDEMVTMVDCKSGGPISPDLRYFTA